MDTSAHETMYKDFIKLLKYCSIGTAVVLVIMAVTLV